MRLLEEHAHLSHDVQLRIETFYTNARVLMDAVVILVDELKRPCAVTIGGHTNLEKLLPRVVALGCLEQPPERLVDLIGELTRRIKNFRDDHVSHIHEARNLKGMTFNSLDAQSARISVFDAFPTDAAMIESELPSELWPLIEEYLDLWIDYLVRSLDGPEQPPFER